jgi:hypothetical protein
VLSWKIIPSQGCASYSDQGIKINSAIKECKEGSTNKYNVNNCKTWVSCRGVAEDCSFGRWFSVTEWPNYIPEDLNHQCSYLFLSYCLLMDSDGFFFINSENVLGKRKP